MRIHVVVKGRVQGVGFRWFVREVGRRRSLAGWVRNLADGSVEVIAEGAEQDIAALKSQLAQGPGGANVEAVEEMDTVVASDLPRPFAIIR